MVVFRSNILLTFNQSIAAYFGLVLSKLVALHIGWHMDWNNRSVATIKSRNPKCQLVIL